MTEIKEFKVPAHKLGKLEQQIATLNRRATKLGVTPVELVRVRDEFFEVEDESRPGAVRRVPAVVLTIQGENPKLPGGWKFAATIQHTTEGNIIRSAGANSPESPARFRTAPPLCEHCQKVRNRIDTFLLINEAGDFRQVGRNCIADFLGGQSPEHYAFLATFFASIQDALTDACDEGDVREYLGSGGGKLLFKLQHFLTQVAAIVRHEGGFWSKSAVDKLANPKDPTSAVAVNVMFPPKGLTDKQRTALEALRPEDRDEKFAEVALTWAREFFGAVPVEARNDFQHNMAVVSAQEYISFREIGLAAYLVEAYRRELGAQEECKRAAVSNHVGEVGQRLKDLELIVVGCHPFDSDFGGGCFIKFMDGAGNRLTWKASNHSGEDIGAVFKVTGTVKSHDEWKGIKETRLTRCKTLVLDAGTKIE
jgi:hypothetical protein